jgi:hypothetical protein
MRAVGTHAETDLAVLLLTPGIGIVMFVAPNGALDAIDRLGGGVE